MRLCLAVGCSWLIEFSPSHLEVVSVLNDWMEAPKNQLPTDSRRSPHPSRDYKPLCYDFQDTIFALRYLPISCLHCISEKSPLSIVPYPLDYGEFQ